MLYLVVSLEAVSAVLNVEREREHKPVYNMRKVLQDAELRYSNIEKLSFALIVAGKNLHPYFLSHQLIALTNHLLKKVLSSPDASSMLHKLVAELSEYVIEYQLRSAIRTQVLTYFIVEMETSDTDSSILPRRSK